MPRKLYLYIAKHFISKLLLVAVSIALLVSIINLFELLDESKDSTISWIQIIQMDLLQIPRFLEDMSIFLIILATMISLFSLSSKSEITIMRGAGLSFWKILLPMVFCAFVIGVLSTTLFNPLSIIAGKKLTVMRQQLISNEESDILMPSNGIWLKQQNMLKPNQEVIIRAQTISRKNFRLKNVTLWFIGEGKEFYQRIDADSMLLNKNYWLLDRPIINNDTYLNEQKQQLRILTDLKEEFISKKILNNFQDVNLFSVYDLPSLIDDLSQFGFSPRKFIVHFHSLLIKPFLFISMVLIAAFFAVNHIRNKNNVLLFTMGIMSGLILYVGLSIISAFGASGLIPIFLSTWMTAIILLAISILLIFKKEVG